MDVDEISEDFEAYRMDARKLCDDAETAMDNENADRQTILENLIDAIRSL
jgi:hypothetical protein